jgi:hypothetical protein
VDGEAVKAAVLTALDYSYLHEDWVNPLAEALEGVTAEQAAWRPGPQEKGIWDIVLHLAVWNENIVERMRTGEKARPAEGAWPPLPAALDEQSWLQAKRRLWDSLDGLRNYLGSLPPEGLMSGPWGLGDLLCRFTHNGYHIGQITKLRECRAGGQD